jgi:hypothetical protein
MEIKEVYRRWAAQELSGWRGRGRGKTKPDDIDDVSFYSSIGSGSPNLDDPDFSTFAGAECWTTYVTMKDGSHEYINHYDSCPAWDVNRFIKENNLTVEFDPPEPPTLEDQIEDHMRSY